MSLCEKCRYDDVCKYKDLYQRAIETVNNLNIGFPLSHNIKCAYHRDLVMPNFSSFLNCNCSNCRR
jgi:hypothetical protein